MKKLLLVSIVLLVAGIGLILYADPVLTTTSSGPGAAVSSIQTAGSGGGGSISPPSGSNCSTQTNGAIQCTGGPAEQSVSGTTEILTVAGIMLCGAGLLLSAIEAISKAPSLGTPQVVA